MVGCAPPSSNPSGRSSAQAFVPSATANSEPTATGDHPAVSADPVGGDEASCQNVDVGYSLSFPAAWFVHPGDPQRDISDCSLFGPEPFAYAADAHGFGASVLVSDFEGRCLDFEPGTKPDPLDQVTVADLPAFRIDVGPDGLLSQHYSYLVNLRPHDGPILDGIDVGPCGHNHGLEIRTDASSSGDYALHRRVVDRIAATLEVQVREYPPGTGADPHCPFPRDVELAFVGHSTLGALGFEDSEGPMKGSVGTVYVTAGPIPLGNPAPQRAYCQVIRANGDVFTRVAPVPAAWILPAELTPEASGPAP